MKGIADRPVLGWGPENFESAFYYHYDPVTLRYSDYETRQDRPHNIILDVMVNLGIIGFLAYAAIFFFGWKLLWRRGDPGRSLLALSTVSLLATNFFIFETPASYITMYFLLSIMAAAITPEPESGTDRYSKWAIPAALLALALFFWVLFGILVGTIKASKITARMIVSLNRPLPVEIFDAQLDELLKQRSPLIERYIRALSSHISPVRGIYLRNNYLLVLKKMTDYETAQVENCRNDYVHALVLATSLLGQEARTPEQQAVLEASIDRMYALSPRRQEVFWTDAYMLVARGDREMAEQSVIKAIELDPEIRISHAEYAWFLMQYGLADRAFSYLEKPWIDAEGRWDYLRDDQDEPRIKSRWDAVNEDLSAKEVIARGMIWWFNSQNFKKLYEVYRSSVEHNIRTAEWTITGAVAAAALGNIQEARTIATEARELYPEKAHLIDDLMRQFDQVKNP